MPAPLMTPFNEEELKKKLEEKFGGYQMAPMGEDNLMGSLTPSTSSQVPTIPQFQPQGPIPMEKPEPEIPPVLPEMPPLKLPGMEQKAPEMQPSFDIGKMREDDGFKQFYKSQKAKIDEIDKLLEQEQGKGPSIGELIGMAFAGVGQAMTGEKYLDKTLELTRAAKQDKLKALNDQRKRELNSVEEFRSEKKIEKMMDPNSDISKMYRDLAATYTGKQPDTFEKMSAYDISDIIPPIQAMYEAKMKKIERDIQLNQANKAKQLPPAQVIAVTDGAAVGKMLPDIETTIEQNKDLFGPVGGRLAQANPYDERGQSVDAQMRAASQAFGRFMEGGVLRKEDEEKYRRMFPQLGDRIGTAQNKLAIIRRLLAQRYTDTRNALTASGYDTSGLLELDIPPSIWEKEKEKKMEGGKPMQKKPAPYGNIVMQKGKTYKWDGTDYVEVGGN